MGEGVCVGVGVGFGDGERDGDADAEGDDEGDLDADGVTEPDSVGSAGLTGDADALA